MDDVERHIQQTTDRLQCIKQHLQSANSFQNAARELLDWCMDDRAFQPHFEVPLFNCLTVVGRVSAQTGYDLDIGYRLLSVCAAHKDRFSAKSASLLACWSEELGQLLLQRQQGKRTGGAICATTGELKGDVSPSGAIDRQQHKNSSAVKFLPGSPWSSTNQSPAVPQWHSNFDIKMSPSVAPPSVENHDHQSSVNLFQQTLPAAAAGGHSMMSGSYQKQQQQQQPGPGAYRNNNNIMSTSSLNGYPPTPTSPGNGQPAVSLLGDSIQTDTLVSRATTGVATMATAGSSSYAGWQRNDGVRTAMNVNMYNGYRPQTRMMYSSNGVGERTQYHSPYCDPVRGSVPPAASSMHRYHPYSSSSSRFSVPLQSNMIHDVNTQQHHHHHQQHQQHPQHSMHAYQANPQQYMKCKRAMCPSGMQPMYGMYRPAGPQSSYFGPRSGSFYNNHHHHQQQQQQQQPLPGGVPMMPTRVNEAQYGVGEFQQGGFQTQNGYINGNGFHQSAAEFPGQQNADLMTTKRVRTSQPLHLANCPTAPQSYVLSDNENERFLAMTSRDSPCQVFNQHQGQLPGNPTPPVTPGSGGSAIYSSLIKPCDVIEPRVTFPLPDGMIMAPFRLQHNLAVSNHVFHLDESIYQSLACRADMELQLKCFHHEDREMTTNWPASVMVSVNANPMSIDVHRPINIKDVCQLNRNTIQITVTACCCSHMFLLQLVRRPTVRSIVTNLMRKQLLLVEQCILKVKQYSSGMLVSGDGFKLSLKCPISLSRIRFPARGRECHHIQCFDVEAYLHVNSDRRMWHCPICKKPVTLDDIEINQLQWSILETLRGSPTDSDNVVLDSSLSTWKVVPLDDTGCSNGVPSQDSGRPASPDILMSLAQMGNNFADPSTNPTPTVTSSSQPSCFGQVPPECASSPSMSSSSLAESKPWSPPAVPPGSMASASPSSASPQNAAAKTVTSTSSSSSINHNNSSSSSSGVSEMASSIDVTVTSSTCLTSEPPHSTTGNEYQLSDEDDTAFRSDLSLDLLVSDNAIGDPAELLAYLGPSSETDPSSFGPSEDLLSLFATG